MKKFFGFSVVMLVGILLAGCSKDDYSIPEQLTAHKWICYGFGNVEDATLIPIVPGAMCYQLEYNTDGTYKGRTFANYGGGEYRIDGNRMYISGYCQTQVYAPNTDDDKFSAIIGQQIESYVVTDTELRLFYNNGQEFLLFGVLGGQDPTIADNLTVNGSSSLGVKALSGRWKLVYDGVRQEDEFKDYAQFMEDGTASYEENVGEEDETVRSDEWTAENDWRYREDNQTMTGRIHSSIWGHKQYNYCTLRGDSLFIYTASYYRHKTYCFFEDYGLGLVKVRTSNME